MKLVKVIILLFVFSAPTQAGWTEYGKIVSVMPYSDGNLHVWANMARHDPGSCGNDRYVMPANAPNVKNIKETLSVALAALAADINVRFFIESAGCTAGNPTLKAIELRP